MRSRRISTDEVVDLVRDYLQQKYPTYTPIRFTVDMARGAEAESMRFPIPLVIISAPEPEPEDEPAATAAEAADMDDDWEIHPFQEAILEALEGKALKTRALGQAVGDAARLYRPRGLKELRARGLVKHDNKVGFYRPDAPPPGVRFS